MLSLLGASRLLCPHLRPPAIKSIPYTQITSQKLSKWTHQQLSSNITIIQVVNLQIVRGVMRREIGLPHLCPMKY